MQKLKRSILGLLLLLSAGCSTLNFDTLPRYMDAKSDKISTIRFSNESIFESEDGVPSLGKPIICSNGKRYLAEDNNGSWREQIIVEGDKEVVLTSVVQMSSAGWTKWCGKYVSFKAEANSKYVIVGERVGGKGISALWTGVGLMSCRVSVFKDENGTYEKVITRDPPSSVCDTKL